MPAYHYYLRDHLGNNRVVLRSDGKIEQATDYYPFGMPFEKGINPEKQPYKFGSKELDEMFGLNWYDQGARPFGAVLPVTPTMDALSEKHYWSSSYAQWGNNPVNRIDPDGRDDYYTNTGLFIHQDDKKTDEIRIVNNYEEQLSKQYRQKSSGKIDYSKLESVGIGEADLSAKAFSNIFTDILSKMDDVDTKELFNGKVSVALFDGNDENLPLKDQYNTNVTEYTEVASHQGVRGKSLVTASIVHGDTKDNLNIYSTVSNVQNLLGAHELLGHGINGWGSRTQTHYKVYEFQMAHPSWSNTTPQFKAHIIFNYNKYLNPNR